MNFELFLARRLSTSKLNRNYYSGPITNICIFAIAVSIIIMIIATGSTSGLKIAIKKTILNSESDIKISNIYNNHGTEPIQIDSTLIEKVKKIKGVKYIHPIINKTGIISGVNNIEGIILKGIEENYKSEIIKNSIIEGDYFHSNKKNEIIISSKQSKKLQLKVGESCFLYFLSKNNNLKKRKFIISGIYEMENETFNDIYAFAKKEYIQNINKWNDKEVEHYEIELNQHEELDEIVKKINNILSYNLLARSIETRFPKIFNWINLFEKNMFFILTIMCIICLINMTNALLILVLERVQMIGTLKSYGCSNYSILKIFLYNGVKIALTGIIIGNIVGITLCLIQEKTQIIRLDSASYFVNYLPIYLDFKFIIFMNIITLFITQISIIIPYYVIKNLTPSNILKIN